MVALPKRRVLLALTLELGNKVMSQRIFEVVSHMEEVEPVTFFWGEKEDYQRYYPKRVPSDVVRTLVGASRKRRDLNDGEADALILNGWEQVIVFRDMVSRVPSAAFLDTTPLQQLRMFGERPGVKRHFFCRLWHLWMRRLARHVSQWCPATQFLADSLKSDFDLHSYQIRVVRHAVDTGIWLPSPEKRPNHPRLLFVGNAFQRKGGPFLLRVKELLPKQYELIIVSNDPCVKKESLDDNTLLIYGLDHSSLAELVSWYQSSHLFVFPTWNEPFGLVLIESAACGTPAIVRDLGPQREAVEHERSGLLMSYHSTPEEWAEAIQQLFADRERLEAFGKRARQIVEERYYLELLQRQIREVVSLLVC